MSVVRRWTSSSPARLVFGLGVAAFLAFTTLNAQIPSRNVNMVAGTDWPNGDPFLQRQNEPSIAASTRNPVASARRFQRLSDGRCARPARWRRDRRCLAWFVQVARRRPAVDEHASSRLPTGQVASRACLSAQGLRGRRRRRRAGRPNGLFFFSGLAFDREDNGKSGIFVARFIDNNNKEAGDPIAYLGTSLVAYDSGIKGRFLDKPWMAVDIPRGNSNKCSIPIPAAPSPATKRQKPEAQAKGPEGAGRPRFRCLQRYYWRRRDAAI